MTIDHGPWTADDTRRKARVRRTLVWENMMNIQSEKLIDYQCGAPPAMMIKKTTKRKGAKVAKKNK